MNHISIYYNVACPLCKVPAGQSCQSFHHGEYHPLPWVHTARKRAAGVKLSSEPAPRTIKVEVCGVSALCKNLREAEQQLRHLYYAGRAKIQQRRLELMNSVPLFSKCDLPEPIVETADGARVPIAYAYGRVSTNKQMHSPATQRAMCEQFYHQRLSSLRWGGVYLDLATSAHKKTLQERVAGGALLCRIKDGDHIILPRLDRAFRRAKDAIQMLDEWNGRNITVHLMDFGVDTASPTGRLMLGMLAMFAEFERALTSERTKAVLRGPMKLRRMLPYGLKRAFVPNKTANGSAFTWIANDPELANIMHLCDLNEQGMSVDKVWGYCVKNEVMFRGNVFSRGRVQRVIEWEKRRRAKYKELGEELPRTIVWDSRANEDRAKSPDRSFLNGGSVPKLNRHEVYKLQREARLRREAEEQSNDRPAEDQ